MASCTHSREQMVIDQDEIEHDDVLFAVVLTLRCLQWRKALGPQHVIWSAV